MTDRDGGTGFLGAMLGVGVLALFFLPYAHGVNRFYQDSMEQAVDPPAPCNRNIWTDRTVCTFAVPEGNDGKVQGQLSELREPAPHVEPRVALLDALGRGPLPSLEDLLVFDAAGRYDASVFEAFALSFAMEDMGQSELPAPPVSYISQTLLQTVCRDDSDTLEACFSPGIGVIYVDQELIADRRELLVVLVHEFAHYITYETTKGDPPTCEVDEARALWTSDAMVREIANLDADYHAFMHLHMGPILDLSIENACEGRV